MCGIAGILNLRGSQQIDEDLLKKMLASIRYRGPDESGIYIDSRIGMGQVRLSIIGLKDGTQPISNEDGSLWIVYNGEAFNYIELKEELIKKGHKFSTSTDTEVVLHLYQEYGPQCLEKINGQFAFAIWDVRRKELFMARDRLGIRPLYYCQAGKKILFASEIKAIFNDPEVTRKIDVKSLFQLFTFWTTLTPGTIFEGVYELPPGQYIIIKQGKISQKSYWSIPGRIAGQDWRGTFEKAKEELKSLLTDAVRIRLRADVPVGAYASGGLDSSIITSLISGKFNNQLKTFSIGFEEKGFDESFYQNKLVNHLGTEHQQTLATNAGICDSFADIAWHCEKPVLRTAPVPLFLLSKMVRDHHFKVVLTGEGADEIFGGYNIYKEAKVRQFWSRRPESQLRPLLLEKLYPYIFDNPSRARSFYQRFYAVNSQDLNDPLFSHRIRWKNTGKNKLFFSENVLQDVQEYDPFVNIGERLPDGFESRDTLSKAQFLEMDTFLSNYLLSSQGDRVAMAHSLEIRLPFLDHRVVEFALSLPPKWLISGLDEKYILKHAFKGMVPDSIRCRAKQPYRAPIREVFFNGGKADYVDDMLSDDCLKKTGLFNPKRVGKLVAKYRKAEAAVNSEVQNMALVGILSTQLVHHQFIDNFPWKEPESLEPDKVVRAKD